MAMMNGALQAAVIYSKTEEVQDNTRDTVTTPHNHNMLTTEWYLVRGTRAPVRYRKERSSARNVSLSFQGFLK